jgi:hypothetical protein
MLLERLLKFKLGNIEHSSPLDDRVAVRTFYMPDLFLIYLTGHLPLAT